LISNYFSRSWLSLQDGGFGHWCQFKKKAGLKPAFIGIRIKSISTISEQLSGKITDFFEKSTIDSLARESGFVKRERTISGFDFLQTLLFSKFDNSKLSLESLAESFMKLHHKEITKQGIDQRFTEETVVFLKS
jgi:hypothetical protein